MKHGMSDPLRLTGAIFLFLSLSFCVRAQPPRGVTVYGRVFLPDNQPALQLTVNIVGQNGYTANTKTDGRGGFRFDGIPRSFYSLTVNVPSNVRYYTEPVSVDARDGNSFTADIFLRNQLESTTKKIKSAEVVSAREAGQQIPKEAHKAFDKAQKYREQKKYDAALAELDKAIAVYPDYFQAFAEKGAVLINSGDPRQALREFHRAFQLYPEYEPALSGAGYCQLILGSYQQAIALLERAAEINPTRAQNHLFLGISHLALSRWEKSQEALEKSLKLDADGMTKAHLYLADAFAGQNLFSRAADELHLYLQLNPQAPDADRLREREKSLRAKTAKQG